MFIGSRLYTVEEFATIRTDEPWELWQGELRKLPRLEYREEWIAEEFFMHLAVYSERASWGIATTWDARFLLSRNPDIVIAPDVGFIGWDYEIDCEDIERILPRRPDLAVEIRSPWDRRRDIDMKRAFYLRFEVPLVWWVYPVTRTVKVFRRGRLVNTLSAGDVLDGEDVLPRFSLALNYLFWRVDRGHF